MVFCNFKSIKLCITHKCSRDIFGRAKCLYWSYIRIRFDDCDRGGQWRNKDPADPAVRGAPNRCLNVGQF